MAELMKRQYGLLSLSVRLDMAATQMRVVFELEADADGERVQATRCTLASRLVVRRGGEDLTV